MPVDIGLYGEGDRNSYWADTVVYHTDLCIPVKILHFEGDSVYVLRLDNADTFHCSMYDLDLKYPRIGVQNTTHSVSVLRQLPRRQWKKGFRFSGVDIIPLFNDECYHAGLNRNFDHHLYEDIFRPKKFTPSELLGEIMKGSRVAGALSEELSMGVSLRYPDMLLMYYDNVIGTVNDNLVAKVFTDSEIIHNQVSKILEVDDGSQT